MTKKNLLSLMLASALLLTLAACGGEIAKQQRKREPFGDGEHIGLRATGRVV